MPEQGTVAVGIDVGGSAVKLGAVAVDAGGRATVLGERSVAVDPDVVLADVLDAVASQARAVSGGRTPTAVGVGVPGVLDRENGVVLHSPNLPWLTGAAVRDELARRLDARVLVENDANVAALGEQWLGAARDVDDVLVLTLGTGIGGGLVLGGRLHVGEGLGGEIGHVVVDPEGRACGCGGRGCLETLASATAARRRALERGLPADAPGDLARLAEVARAGEGPERELLEQVGRDLGHGLALAVALLDLREFVCAGGFAAALDVLEPGVRAGLAEWAYGDRVAQVRIVRATLGASAGWTGAARLAFRATEGEDDR